MPLYNYICNACEQEAIKAVGHPLDDQECEEYCIFETSHSMNPSAAELMEATICPRCNGNDTTKYLHGSNITGYIKGDGYLDRAGCKRDMNLFHLTQDDPYGEYRVPGEVDDIKAKLKRAGQHNPHSKHFVVSNNEMQTAVEKAVFSKPDSKDTGSIVK